jgi:hypothetical protein
MDARTMTQDELAAVLGWARDEGWNPGLDDAAAFHAADPEGFLLVEERGSPAAAVSVARHAPGLGFLGLYLCRPDLRGRGLGMAVWRAGMARLEGCVVGLDGVAAQQENYRRSGFVLSHRNIRFTGVLAGAKAEGAVPLEALPAGTVAAFDAAVTGYGRPRFLAAWTAPRPTRRGLALLRDGRLLGWGVIRACVEGSKIGPLQAVDADAARALAHALSGLGLPQPVSIDAPEPNGAAVALAGALGLAPAFETARMWRGPAPAEDLDRTFGVATLELG